MIKINRELGVTLSLLTTLTFGACDLDTLLEVDTPDLVTPEDIQGARGAELFAAGALGQFQEVFGGSQIVLSGLLADEFHYTGVFPPLQSFDARTWGGGVVDGVVGYGALHGARVGLENAAAVVAEFLPGDSRLAEMHALAGYSYVFFGEHFCSGVPFGATTPSGATTQGLQRSTEQTFSIALEKFALTTQFAAGSADLAYLASVGAARTLVDLGLYAEAAAEVSSVPTEWLYMMRYKAGASSSQENRIYQRSQIGRDISLSDLEGSNGLPFRSETDARVPWTTDGTNGADNQTPHFALAKYTSLEDDIVLASGIEARLVEAEAALHTGDVVLMMTKLNELRETMALGDMTDPGTLDGRVDLLFSERARWMFATAHRLGDLRRLIRQYGRSAETVFPVGAHHRGGFYGEDVDVGIPDTEDANPNFSGCFSRGA